MHKNTSIKLVVFVTLFLISFKCISQEIDEISTTSAMLIEKEGHRSWVSGSAIDRGNTKTLHYGVNFGKADINLPAYSKFQIYLQNDEIVSFTIIKESKLESGNKEFSFGLSDEKLEKLKSSPVLRIRIEAKDRIIDGYVNENNATNIIKVLMILDQY